MIIENVLQTPIILLIKRYAFNYLYTHMLEFGFTNSLQYHYHVIIHLIKF